MGNSFVWVLVAFTFVQVSAQLPALVTSFREIESKLPVSPWRLPYKGLEWPNHGSDVLNYKHYLEALCEHQQEAREWLDNNPLGDAPKMATRDWFRLWVRRTFVPVSKRLAITAVVLFGVTLVRGEGRMYLSDLDTWAWEWVHPWASVQELGLDKIQDIELPNAQHVSYRIRQRNLRVIVAVLEALAEELVHCSTKYLVHAINYPGTERTAQFGERVLHSMTQLLLLLSLIGQMWSDDGLATMMEQTKDKQDRRIMAGMPVTTIKELPTDA